MPKLLLQSAFCVLLTFLHHFFVGEYLLAFWQNSMSYGHPGQFLRPNPGTQTLLQRVLVPLSGRWYLETKIWGILVCHHGVHPSLLSSCICNAFSSDRKLAPIILLKTRQQTSNGVTYPNPHIIKLRLNLITISASPRNRNLNQAIRNHLVNISELICLKK